MSAKVPVGPGTKVRLRFTLSLDSGELIDQTGAKGAEFTVGDGNLPPGFEQALFGLRPGEQKRATIDSASAFGEPKEENIQWLPRGAFAGMALDSGLVALEPGLVVSFADPGHAERPGMVAEVTDDKVKVDFNHPLAGRDLLFDAEILAVEQISQDILRSS